MSYMVWKGNLLSETFSIKDAIIWSHGCSFVPAIMKTLYLSSCNRLKLLWELVLNDVPKQLSLNKSLVIDGKSISALVLSASSSGFKKLINDLTTGKQMKMMYGAFLNEGMKVETIIVPQCPELSLDKTNLISKNLSPILIIIFVTTPEPLKIISLETAKEEYQEGFYNSKYSEMKYRPMFDMPIVRPNCTPDELIGGDQRNNLLIIERNRLLINFLAIKGDPFNHLENISTTQPLSLRKDYVQSIFDISSPSNSDNSSSFTEEKYKNKLNIENNEQKALPDIEVKEQQSTLESTEIRKQRKMHRNKYYIKKFKVDDTNKKIENVFTDTNTYDNLKPASLTSSKATLSLLIDNSKPLSSNKSIITSTLLFDLSKQKESPDSLGGTISNVGSISPSEKEKYSSSYDDAISQSDVSSVPLEDYPSNNLSASQNLIYEEQPTLLENAIPDSRYLKKDTSPLFNSPIHSKDDLMTDQISSIKDSDSFPDNKMSCNLSPSKHLSPSSDRARKKKSSSLKDKNPTGASDELKLHKKSKKHSIPSPEYKKRDEFVFLQDSNFSLDDSKKHKLDVKKNSTYSIDVKNIKLSSIKDSNSTPDEGKMHKSIFFHSSSISDVAKKHNTSSSSDDTKHHKSSSKNHKSKNYHSDIVKDQKQKTSLLKHSNSPDNKKKQKSTIFQSSFTISSMDDTNRPKSSVKNNSLSVPNVEKDKNSKLNNDFSPATIKQNFISPLKIEKTKILSNDNFSPSTSAIKASSLNDNVACEKSSILNNKKQLKRLKKDAIKKTVKIIVSDLCKNFKIADEVAKLKSMISNYSQIKHDLKIILKKKNQNIKVQTSFLDPNKISPKHPEKKSKNILQRKERIKKVVCESKTQTFDLDSLLGVMGSCKNSKKANEQKKDKIECEEILLSRTDKKSSYKVKFFDDEKIEKEAPHSNIKYPEEDILKLNTTVHDHFKSTYDICELVKEVKVQSVSGENNFATRCDSNLKCFSGFNSEKCLDNVILENMKDFRDYSSINECLQDLNTGTDDINSLSDQHLITNPLKIKDTKTFREIIEVVDLKVSGSPDYSSHSDCTITKSYPNNNNIIAATHFVNFDLTTNDFSSTTDSSIADACNLKNISEDTKGRFDPKNKISCTFSYEKDFHGEIIEHDNDKVNLSQLYSHPNSQLIDVDSMPELQEVHKLTSDMIKQSSIEESEPKAMFELITSVTNNQTNLNLKNEIEVNIEENSTSAIEPQRSLTPNLKKEEKIITDNALLLSLLSNEGKPKKSEDLTLISEDQLNDYQYHELSELFDPYCDQEIVETQFRKKIYTEILDQKEKDSDHRFYKLQMDSFQLDTDEKLPNMLLLSVSTFPSVLDKPQVLKHLRHTCIRWCVYESKQELLDGIVGPVLHLGDLIMLHNSAIVDNDLSSLISNLELHIDEGHLVYLPIKIEESFKVTCTDHSNDAQDDHLKSILDINLKTIDRISSTPLRLKTNDETILMTSKLSDYEDFMKLLHKELCYAHKRVSIVIGESMANVSSVDTFYKIMTVSAALVNFQN